MDIPNLAQNSQTSISNPDPTPIQAPIPPKSSNNSKTVYFIILILAIVSGFWASRFWPISKSSNSLVDTIAQKDITSADNIKSADQIEIGKYYGETGKTFTDSATGLLVKGGINGEGTHTLQRDGGKTQYAALTSSTIDLDLFADKKVEIKGETNSSRKAGWFLDVGVIKILE